MNFIFNRNFAKVFGILCVFKEAWTRNMPKIIFSMLLKEARGRNISEIIFLMLLKRSMGKKHA